MSIRRLLYILCVSIFLVGNSSIAWSHPVSYSEMISRLHKAAQTGRVRVVDLGESIQHRQIPLAAIGKDNARVRVMILCRQHGDEPVSTGAALEVIERYAKKDPRICKALQGTLLLVIPMVNPDGAEAMTRVNAVGADINRDWNTQSQPETQAVAHAFQILQPQVILDEHEWTPTDDKGSNSLEVVLNGDPVSLRIQKGVVEDAKKLGVNLRATHFLPDIQDSRLAHRHFGLLGTQSFLLETTPDVLPSIRASLYISAILTACRCSAKAVPAAPCSGTVSKFSSLFDSQGFVENSSHNNKWILFFSFIGLIGVTLILTAAHSKHPEENSSKIIKKTSHIKKSTLTELDDLSDRFSKRRKINRPDELPIQ